jgi:carboxyl-terminal processing protease
VLTTLEEKLIEDDIDEELKSSIDKLKAAINTAKADDFEQYKDEIIFEVEQELVSRYFNQKGRIQKQLQNDSEVSAAIELLNDRTRYDDILKSPM